MKGANNIDSKAEQWEAITTTMSKIEPADLLKNQCIKHYWLLLRKRIIILKCKGFKVLYVFVIYSTVGVDQFFMIL